MASPKTEKFCRTCQTTKSATEFYKSKNPDGLQSECKECHKARNRRRYANNTEYMLDYQMYTKYGLTRAQYEVMLAAQNGGCAICKTKHPGSGCQRFCVDHDHDCCAGPKTCGECVRGLLCIACNSGLGSFRDSISILSNAIVYLS